MKYTLWVVAESDILKARVAIWAFSAIVTSKEYFEYIDDPNCKRVGPYFWLSTYTVLIEYGIWIKFSRDIFALNFPWYVYVIFASYTTMFLLGAAYSYCNGGLQGKGHDTQHTKYNLLDPELTIEDTVKVYQTGQQERRKKMEWKNIKL